MLEARKTGLKMVEFWLFRLKEERRGTKRDL
jgi:hypothetical protein